MAYNGGEIADGTKSTKLGVFVKFEDTTIGKYGTPARIVHYTDNGEARKAQYFKGKLDEASVNVLKALKVGDKFTVTKVKAGQYWNLESFGDAANYTPKPAYNGGGGFRKPFEKKEFDNTGIKVGAARNQALQAMLVQADKYKSMTQEKLLDALDDIAIEIYRRQAAMEALLKGEPVAEVAKAYVNVVPEEVKQGSSFPVRPADEPEEDIDNSLDW